MARRHRSQGGIALLLFLFLLFGVVATVALSAWNSSAQRLAQEQKNQEVLQQARDALIAYAVSVYPLNSDRPGDLPCPDLDNDGKKDNGCGNASGSTGQDKRLGRLPWKSLGLPDLRDASGERLWYAVSNNFKENARHLPLNSDTPGTIQVADNAGNVIPNIVAVVIAPGPALQRLGANAVQDRSPAGQNDPHNYLDTSGTEDNADFIDSTNNGFVNGLVRDAQGNLLVNDNLLVITYNDLMPLIEKKVAATVMRCLTSYAAFNDGTYNNLGRYPWPASMSTSAGGSYDDSANTLYGRIPNLMCNTAGTGLGMTKDPLCPTTLGTNPGMLASWGGIEDCTITHPWFSNNWREQVFYAVADAYKPGTIPPACGSCLTVGSNNKVQLAVLVGRQALKNQDRSVKALIGNYLEGSNAVPQNGVFDASALSATFNDLLVFK